MNENKKPAAAATTAAPDTTAARLLAEGLAAAGFATAHKNAADESDPMIWAAVGQLPHVFQAAVALVCGDLPPAQREHAESALCIARAYCLLSSQGRAYAWEMIVNADLDAPAWQAPLLALELADELRHEAMVQEDDPTFTVERDARRVHGLDGEALDAYMAAARRLRDLPPVPARPAISPPGHAEARAGGGQGSAAAAGLIIRRRINEQGPRRSRRRGPFFMLRSCVRAGGKAIKKSLLRRDFWTKGFQRAGVATGARVISNSLRASWGDARIGRLVQSGLSFVSPPFLGGVANARGGTRWNNDATLRVSTK